MIRITVELVSAVHPSRSRHLCSAVICNDGTGDKSSGNYTVQLNGSDGKMMWTGRVLGYARRSQHTWRLVRMALNAWANARGYP